MTCPTQALSIVGDDGKRDIHEAGAVLDPAVTKAVIRHKVFQLVSGIESGRSMNIRMLDTTDLVEDDEIVIPRNTISEETVTDGVKKGRDLVPRYDPCGEPELTIAACSTPKFVTVCSWPLEDFDWEELGDGWTKALLIEGLLLVLGQQRRWIIGVVKAREKYTQSVVVWTPEPETQIRNLVKTLGEAALRNEVSSDDV